MISLAFVSKIAKLTSDYCYNDWVLEKTGHDRDGNPKVESHFVDYPTHTGVKATPGRQHYTDKEKPKHNIASGSIIFWISILIINGAHFGSEKRSACKLWRRSPHGFYFPYIHNTMTIWSFKFMRWYMHFSDNKKQIPKGVLGYDPLFKVRDALDKMMKVMSSAWNTGKHVTIDESMIKYMGHAVFYVQYILTKPIKHGIKVFAVCCVMTVIMLGFTIYVWEEDDCDNTALNVCHILLQKSGFTGRRGCVLYTKNYYTSVKLSKHFL